MLYANLLEQKQPGIRPAFSVPPAPLANRLRWPRRGGDRAILRDRQNWRGAAAAGVNRDWGPETITGLEAAVRANQRGVGGGPCGPRCRERQPPRPLEPRPGVRQR